MRVIKLGKLKYINKYYIKCILTYKYIYIYFSELDSEKQFDIS